MLPKIAVCLGAQCDRPALKRGLCQRCYQRVRTSVDAPLPTVTAMERFWEKVDHNGPIPDHAPQLGACWVWTGCTNEDGYGQFAVVHGRAVRSHAYSLEMATGQPRPTGLEACHHCDNPPCVRPSHLYWGTHQDNMDDSWERSRHPVGSERAAARVNEEQVLDIRKRYAAGERNGELAAEFGLDSSTISGIVTGRKWAHVAGPITNRRTRRGTSKIV